MIPFLIYIILLYLFGVFVALHLIKFDNYISRKKCYDTTPAKYCWLSYFAWILFMVAQVDDFQILTKIEQICIKIGEKLDEYVKYP